MLHTKDDKGYENADIYYSLKGCIILDNMLFLSSKDAKKIELVLVQHATETS